MKDSQTAWGFLRRVTLRKSKLKKDKPVILERRWQFQGIRNCGAASSDGGICARAPGAVRGQAVGDELAGDPDFIDPLVPFEMSLGGLLLRLPVPHADDAAVWSQLPGGSAQ